MRKVPLTLGSVTRPLGVVVPAPDALLEHLLGLVFGSPSFVVSTYVLLASLWAWWSVARSTVVTGAIVFDRAQDWFGLGTLKVRATARLAIAWAALFGVGSFVTQLWAGSQYSPGQGGGLQELIHWSVIFGAIAVAGCLYLIPARGPKHGDDGWAPYPGLVGGYVIAALWAVLAFTLKGGPEPGDWWVCPASSCVGVIGSALHLRIRAVASRQGESKRARR